MKFIKIVIGCLLLIGFTAFSNAQSSQTNEIARKIENYTKEGVVFKAYDIITSRQSISVIGDLYKGTQLSIKSDELQILSKNKEETITLQIPNNHGKAFDLQLYKVNIFGSDFSVKNSLSSEKDVSEIGVHYRGIIKGNDDSFVALSFFDNNVMGAIVTKNDQYTIGKIDNSNDHILYENRDLNFNPDMPCGIGDSETTPYSQFQLSGISNFNTANKCVGIYIEVDNDIFAGKGTGTGAYITGLFNQSAALYDNHGISLVLSEIFIWQTTSPYTGNDGCDLLNQFRNNTPTFNGDLGHLVSYKGGGGCAYVDVLCSSYNHAYSGIYSSYNNVPTYSWSINVFSHETGHNLGSQHTHDCVWNGNGTQIDDCGNIYLAANGYSTGACYNSTNPIIPSNGGTIMSYCHLNSVGMNFTEGFGPQPTNVMLNAIANANCLSVCDDCLVSLNHSGPIGSDYYEVSDYITSTGTMASGVNITYDAGDNITLTPGFHATSGSDFHAFIEGCGSTTSNRIGGEESTISIETATDFSFNVFPNPAREMVKLEFEEEINSNNIVFSNLIGQIINVPILDKSEFHSTFDVSNLEGGIYLVTVINNAWKSKSIKLIIK